MSAALERAQLLLAQSRYEEAVRALTEAIAEDSEHPGAHALLALALLKRGRHEEAELAAVRALGLAPDYAFPHFVRGLILVERDALDQAEAAADAAIALDPEQGDFYALASTTRLMRKQWQSALDWAEAGLAVEPDSEWCLNLRAQALLKLGRGGEARAAMAGGLEQRPDDAMTHANQGWVLLETGDPKGALHHFEEALRLDPELDWAREGVVTALKARHLFYRWVLAFSLWMGRFSDGKQWLIILGGYLGFQVLKGVAKAHPSLAVFVWPLMGLYLGFVLLTWVADPLFNLFLRLNRFGRLLLTPREIQGSNVFGALLAGGLVAGLLYLVVGAHAGERLQSTLMFMALICLGMLIPVAATFNAEAPDARKRLGRYTIGLTGLALLFLGLNFAGSPLAGLVGMLGALGLFIFQFYANGVNMKART